MQAVFIFGVEMWVLTPRMEWALSTFHHIVARRLTRMHPSQRGEGKWGYSPLAEDMVEASFEEIRVYITRRQNTVAQYIVTRQILDLCERSIRRPGAWLSWRWWGQEGIDI